MRFSFRKKCELSSGIKTTYKSVKKNVDMSIIFRRKITDINDINDLKFPSDFREFDTVALVVEVKIESAYQEVWLTNLSGRSVYFSTTTYENVKVSFLGYLW